MTDLLVGSNVAGCRLEAVAGRGGMGVVYRATQLALDRTVALKAIAPQLAQDADYRERFERESRIAASIEHPNVIPVYEAGQLDGTLYLIMRWVDGTDLRALIDTSGPLPPPRAVRLLRPVASALAAAHRQGLIHRDVKPANVLIAHGQDEDQEHVYLTDFGIARRAETKGMTRTGVLVGTLDYTSPERIEGGKGGPASDIYAFGCMLFETLTGHVPFPRPTQIARMHAHMNEPVPSARVEIPDVTPALDAVALKAMAKRPEDRFVSAGELAAALGAAINEGGGVTGPPAATADGSESVPETVLAREAADHSEAPLASETILAPEEAATPTVRSAEPPTPTFPAVPAARVPGRPTSGAGSTATTTARRTRPRRSLLLLAVVGLLAVAGGVVALAAGGGGGGNGSRSISGPSETAPAGPRVVLGQVSIGGPVTLGRPPTALAAAGTDGWAAAGGRISLLRQQGAEDRGTVSGNPTSLGVDPQGRVWAAGVGSDGVRAAGPDLIEAGRRTTGIAIGSSAAWIATSGASTITRVDLASLNSTTVNVGGPVAAIGEAYARLWVASPDGTVSVIDDGGQRDPIPAPNVPPGTVGITSSNGVWFLSAGGALTRLDPRAGATVDGHYAEHPNQATVGPRPVAIAASEHRDSIWILTQGDRALTQIATSGPGNNKPVARIQLPAPPRHLAVADQLAWVDVPGTGRVYPISF